MEFNVAKKGTTTRVFQIAKELGVRSKDIVAKCEAEQIPGITNHMSAVSLGLAATIREWFGGAGEGAVATAIETAAKVDLTEVRAKAKKKKATRKKAAKKKEEEEKAAPETVETTAPAAPAEAPAQAPAAEVAAPAQAEPAIVPGEAGIEAPPAEERAIEPPAVTEATGTEAEALPAAAKAPAGPGEPDAGPPPEAPVMNVPARPEVIQPAGPKLQQPSRTKLAGPRVVRVESPDVVPPPRARGGGRMPPVPAGPSRGGRGVGPLAPPPMERPPGGRGGRAAGASRRNKRRSAVAREEGPRPGRGSSAGDRSFNWREQDLLEREQRLRQSGGFLKSARRDNLKRAAAPGLRAPTAAQAGGKVKIAEPLSIKSLSAATGVKTADILKALFLAGKPASINAYIDSDTAVEVMLEHEIELEITEHKTAEEQIVQQFKERKMADEQLRCPVVAILGHVDHGKTSLLDGIRHTNVAEGEAGGITQATSAFRVPVRVGDDERTITFIDTPGHEAFTEMRSRGAHVTDIVVLVVAADDGVMPQTVESINHAKAASVPIIVALNKMDKPEATDTNIQRILGQLAEHELNPVEWGGDTEVVRTSAVKGEGIQDLLEVLDLQAQILEMTADFAGPAEGTVIEAQMEEGRGAVARLLVQQGTLKKGDFVAVGRAFGRVRDIVNDRGKRIREAGPSTPVAISGINEVPDAGDKFYVVQNLKAAEAAAEERKQQERERDLVTEKVTLDNIFQKLSESERKELPLIVKADVQGSLETLRGTLSKIRNDEVVVAIKHAAVGGVNESDIALAEAAGAIVIGFNVTAASAARKAADAKGVDVRFYDVIYDLTDDVTRAAEGLLEPELKLEVIGHAEVRKVFKISKVGMIAGCYVTEGTIERNAQIRVTRDEIVIEKDRRLEQLKRVKDDVKEVKAGQDCGMRIDGYDDIKVGDVLECYKTLEVRRTLH
ncbi:MAG: translation initiation factor IF-2 [Phycisphaerales bacterium]|nr:MAG: translation initiation factor IF-2 [Phycisphaerales bacterium]